MAINQVVVMGVVTSTPKKIVTQETGEERVVFTIANHPYKDVTEFIDIISFEQKVVDFVINHIHEKDLVSVTGYLHVSTKKDDAGVYQQYASIVANNVSYTSIASRQVNSAVIEGNLVDSPRVYSTSEGKLMLNCRFANNRSKNLVEYIDFTLFAEFAEKMEPYLLKGTAVCLTGRIQTTSLTYEKDGHKVHRVGIWPDAISLGRKKEDGEGQQSSDMGSFMNIPEGIEDELPFH